MNAIATDEIAFIDVDSKKRFYYLQPDEFKRLIDEVKDRGALFSDLPIKCWYIRLDIMYEDEAQAIIRDYKLIRGWFYHNGKRFSYNSSHFIEKFLWIMDIF